jgi:hypothetical protein
LLLLSFLFLLWWLQVTNAPSLGMKMMLQLTALSREEARLSEMVRQTQADLVACTGTSPGLITSMRGRRRVNGPLENELGELPFESFEVGS